MSPNRIFEVAKPATVMIQSNYKAEAAVPSIRLSEAQLPQLTKRLNAMVQKGQIGSQEEFNLAAIRLIADNPLTYLEPTEPMRAKEGDVSSIGSGFIINPDGYIVTNAHVVAAEGDEVKSSLVRQALDPVFDSDVKDILGLAGEGVQVPKELVQAVQQGVGTFYSRYARLGDVEQKILAATGVAVPGVGMGQKGHPADIAEMGSPVPGKDVAVLKIEGTNLPTLEPGDDSALTPGDRIYVVGYPAVATFHPILAEESQVEPSLTNGTLSAKKSMAGGWTVLQTDAAMTHGNSGGPVLDANGKVVGIATFISIDPNTGQEVAGMNFVVPIGVVQEFLGRANVKYEQSITSRLYVRALDLYQAKRYKAALGVFEQVNAISPGHPYVQDYITRSQRQIAEGNDRSWTAMLPYLGIALVVIGGAIAAVMYFMRRGGAGGRMQPVPRTIRRHHGPTFPGSHPSFGGGGSAPA